MKALITGASSGIGCEIARQLSAMGIEVILVARRMTRLQEIKDELGDGVRIISMDLADEQSCRLLYERLKEEDIDILVNNAGFGVYGRFDETDLDLEMDLINVNIKAVHILTKLFIRDFIARDYGYILNVASLAGYLPGPLMAAYYASKAYVLRFSEALYGEMKHRGCNVHVSALCPGPVQTEFNQVAGVRFALKGKTAKEVAKIAVRGMFEEKRVIIPGALMKCSHALLRLTPIQLQLRASYFIQQRKKT